MWNIEIKSAVEKPEIVIMLSKFETESLCFSLVFGKKSLFLLFFWLYRELQQHSVFAENELEEEC